MVAPGRAVHRPEQQVHPDRQRQDQRRGCDRDARRTLDACLDRRTGAYRDLWRWSHLMVEADLELYRWTREAYLLERAKRDCDVHYAKWKKDPPKELIDNASLARQLWLMAEHESKEGISFWRKSDRLRK